MTPAQSFAAVGVRLLGVIVLFWSVPAVIALAGAALSGRFGSNGMLNLFSGLLIGPVIGAAMVLYAREIGRVIARGLE